MYRPSEYDILLKPHKTSCIDLESFRDEIDVCNPHKKTLDPKINDLGMKFLSEKLTVNPTKMENVRVHPYNSGNNNKPHSDVARMKILAKATFPNDEKTAKVLYESMHSKYLERIAQQSEKKSSSIPSSTDTPQKSEEEENILTSSLVGFIHDVTDQHVILQEDEPESPLHKIIEEIKALRIKMKNVLSKAGSGLSVLTKIDIKGVTNHKSFSVTAKQVKANVVAFLKFLVQLADPNPKISKFSKVDCSLTVLSDSNIINTFPEVIWVPLQELRIALEKSGFSEQMDALFHQLGELKEYKAKFLNQSKEDNVTIEELSEEKVIDKEMKAYLSMDDSSGPISENEANKLQKSKKKKVYSSNPFIRMGQWINNTFWTVIMSIRYLWRVFWY